MATPTVHVQRPESVDGIADPNILILWLDQYIGVSDDYLLLKRSFFMTVDPTTGYEVPLEQRGIDYSIRSQKGIRISLENIQFTLRAFETVESCFEAFENNLDKRIFLITSATKGKILVPSLVNHFPNQLLENYPLYIFCSNMNMEQVGDVEPCNEWAMDFDDYLVVFTHQDDLLERVVLDAANHFFARAKVLQNAKDLIKAREKYQWTRRLLTRFDKINKKNINTQRHKEIEEIVKNIDDELSTKEDEDQHGESPL